MTYNFYSNLPQNIRFVDYLAYVFGRTEGIKRSSVLHQEWICCIG